EAFTQQGFTATKLDDVAERAGIGKGTIYLYFDSKENLFEEVVRHNLFPFRDAAEAHIASFTGSASELLASHFRNFYASMSNPKIPPLMAMISAEALRFPAIAAFFYKEIITKFQSLLHSIIVKGVESGEFRSDAAGLYTQLLTAPVMVSSLWNMQFSEQAPIAIDRYMVMHIDFVLRAIKA
ncbi:MAG TPA: TetR/AcrR family transcriptional regulator, partial [Candidatus Acidoferrum sp.]|nr:TetR/AcrR family transcriptional regulator [Candidatus Acidoferrum sp.]